MVVALQVLEGSDSVIPLLTKHSHQVYLEVVWGAVSGTRAEMNKDEDHETLPGRVYACSGWQRSS